MHIFVEIGGEKNKGGGEERLIKHMFALSPSYFLKNFLARYARLIISLHFMFIPQSGDAEHIRQGR